MHKTFIVLIAAVVTCPSVAMATSTLYRLPIRSVLDSPVVELFENALDTVLSARFRVVVPTDSTPHHPDSAVCSTELTENDSGGVQFSYNLYLAGRDDVVSGKASVPKGGLDFAAAVLAIQRAFAPGGLMRMALARLRVDGVRDSKVYLDGALYGSIPFEAFVLPGEHEVEVRGRRFLNHTFTVDMQAGTDTLAVVDLRDLSRAPRIALTVTGIVALGAAAYAHRVQEDLYQHYLDPASTRSEFDRRYGDYRKVLTIRNVLAGLGAGALAAGLVLTWDIP
ncbi:MAG: hypothetical protein GF344_03445 [Chitinivibrionales bacterium]|nr:hypothetical protein [Chitinivibrionales bacterium]MBD3356126.1 hypothetical protein [Chitinivibrionales bacterium]